MCVCVHKLLKAVKLHLHYRRASRTAITHAATIFGCLFVSPFISSSYNKNFRQKYANYIRDNACKTVLRALCEYNQRKHVSRIYNHLPLPSTVTGGQYICRSIKTICMKCRYYML